MSWSLRRWNLTELLPDPSNAVVEERLAELNRRVEAFEAIRAELAEPLQADRLEGLLDLYQVLVEKMVVLSAYGSLWFAEDTQSAEALAYKGRMEQHLTEVQNRTLFFTLWWKELEDEVAEPLLQAVQNPDHRHFLYDLRRLRQFALEERSEQLINSKDANGITGVLTLYSMLTNRLEFQLAVDGEDRTLTRDELMSFVYSTDAEQRAAAYQELYRVFGNEATILGQIYLYRVRDWRTEQMEWRGFDEPVAVRNAWNDVPDGAVDALLEVTRDRREVFQRFFRWKAEQLGLPKLRRYDLYAPVGESDVEVPYGEAADQVLDTFRRFDAGFADAAQRVFEDDHVDSETRPGKKGGAFCATVLPSQTPWVLLNYTGKVRDVATMAHELGHAVHSLLAADHSVLTQHACLPLAETASVFSEMLLTDRWLNGGTDDAFRRELLSSKLDDIYATVLRQAYFTCFERDAHRAIAEGASTADLDELYLANLREQFGDAVEVPDEFAHEWTSIPHFFQTPFYCYAYSFGQLLVLALYRRYQEEGEAFVPGYLRLLAHGGAARPTEVLAEIDVDPTDAAFWHGGFDVVDDLVSALTALN